jgi:hypothetical protein
MCGVKFMRLSWTLRKSPIGSKSLGILARILWRVRVPIFCVIRGRKSAHIFVALILRIDRYISVSPVALVKPCGVGVRGVLL